MRPYNFGAGPATLPLPILEKAQAELLDWEGTGMSVMEIGHRTQLFKSLIQKTVVALRALLNVPEHYAVLLLGFPARFQFSMIPMNFLTRSADYLVTGLWSQLAFDEAKKKYPSRSVNDESSFDSEADYVYFTPNETISGFTYPSCPNVNQVPLIADMTSCLLSEPLDVTQFDLLFAGAQKNISIPGLTVVIAKKSFLNSGKKGIDTLCDYRTHLQYESNYATPPNFAIYLAHLMCEWIKTQGGLKEMARLNQKKASVLYEFIDASEAYRPYVSGENRSMMNVAFTLRNEAFIETFLIEAGKRGLLGLKGHRTQGGMRASLYNAMPIEGVYALIDFMRDFSISKKGI